MRNISKLSFIVGLSFVIQTCSSTTPDVSSEHQSSNVATTDTNGVVTAKITASAKVDQIVVASPNSKVKESSVTTPTGALTADAEITYGEADEKGAAILTATGTPGVIVVSSAPLFAMPATGTPPVPGAPLVVQIPLPVQASLTATTGKLVFIYSIYTSTGWKSGVKPLTAENLIGTFLKTTVLGFGYFQTAYLTETVGEKEVSSGAIVPTLKK